MLNYANERKHVFVKARSAGLFCVITDLIEFKVWHTK